MFLIAVGGPVRATLIENESTPSKQSDFEKFFEKKHRRGVNYYNKVHSAGEDWRACESLCWCSYKGCTVNFSVFNYHPWCELQCLCESRWLLINIGRFNWTLSADGQLAYS